MSLSVELPSLNACWAKFGAQSFGASEALPFRFVGHPDKTTIKKKLRQREHRFCTNMTVQPMDIVIAAAKRYEHYEKLSLSRTWDRNRLYISATPESLHPQFSLSSSPSFIPENVVVVVFLCEGMAATGFDLVGNGSLFLIGRFSGS
jgi:hypothetical protein